MAAHFHSLQIKDIRKETPDCISIAFTIPESLKETFAFTQGQNITLKKTIDGEDCRRSYSICSSPLEQELRIAIKKLEGGKFSEWANTQLKKEDLLEVFPPTGKFYAPLLANQQQHYIGFAAGSGITPLISIIKTVLLLEPSSRFTLFYGNRNKSSIIFKEELASLKNKFMDRFSLHHILSRAQSESVIHDGRMDTAKCDLIFQYLLDIHQCDQFFICGPGEMIFSIKEYLESRGVARNKIYFELFTTPDQNRATRVNEASLPSSHFEGKKANISIKLDGLSFSFPLSYSGTSILDAALKTGADLPFACKGGVCATCKAKLLSGKVEMINNYALEPDEIEKGYILCCQAHPRSETVSIDYDIK